MSSAWAQASGTKAPVPGAKRPITAGSLKIFLLVVTCGLLLGSALAFLFRPSSDQTLAGATETEQLNDDGSVRATPVANRYQPEMEVAVPVARQPGSGNRYQVVTEKAYFLDSPQQSTPIGPYLRRGNMFYAEEEQNGFVQTTYVQPNGVRGTGWVKKQSLSQVNEEQGTQADVETAAATAAAAKASALAATRAKRSAAKKATNKSNAARNEARKQESGTRVGGWLRKARDLVRPRNKQNDKSRKQKPCKCSSKAADFTIIGPRAIPA
ncbi:hypothetical protein [Hymenobacter arizonensis]|uniref:Uncharacterized protein n=1 Tax=Hymenobacter arizonensis TaxID=1227077 RepID=A0A1I5UUK1_HYMAR|nr:hypothetical protein [Hymenobacter arizonensis]SFP98890.1 hypothetical protein SAMN04515668_1077 [Hymenobacter arizonensis]